MATVSDTGPLHYLVLTGLIDWIEAVVGDVIVPEQVAKEMTSAKAPAPVRALIASPPAWLSVAEVAPDALQRVKAGLDDGERACIALTLQIPADLLLIDDRAGKAVARSLGVPSVGTLGLIVTAASRGLTDLDEAFEALARTNFRWTAALRHRLLQQHRQLRCSP